MSRAQALLFGCFLAATGCDHVSPPREDKAPSADAARAKAREAMTNIVKAAGGVTSSCVAGELLWEADENVGPTFGGEGFSFRPTPPTHFSRPCIPERCSPKQADIDALKSAVAAAKTTFSADPSLAAPTYRGFLALSEAMVSFVDLASTSPAKESGFSGLSMHHGLLVGAFREVVTDVVVPTEPPSLMASLAVPEPGGDVCKGWRVPRLCDVRAVRVPKVLKWRAEPPCIEVESVKK